MFKTFLMEIASFINLKGAVYGAAGSFVRECAWLYEELQSKKKKKLGIILLFPVWVLCGAIIGSIIGTENNIQALYIMLAGACWRPVISNSKMVMSVIAKTTLELQGKGNQQNQQGNP